jgi:hypothetical protein
MSSQFQSPNIYSLKLDELLNELNQYEDELSEVLKSNLHF